MKVTIDRSKWIANKLADGQGNYCSLGFMFAQAGVPDDYMVASGGNWPTLCAHEKLQGPEFAWMREGGTDWGSLGYERAHGIAVANNFLDNRVREENLTKRYAEVGIELEFV